jgi:FAD/FMN-containing dehydrogenase
VIVNQVPAHLESRVITPESADYGNRRHSYAYRGSPAVIILCESAADVISGLALARSTGAPLSIRSGGHGVASRSTNDGGIVLDLSRMNEVEVVDRAAGLVRIGPGARWNDVALTLDPYGLAIGSGDSGDVGVGGLSVSGGIGLLGRRFGLTIDNLRSVEIVTADGELRHASADENPELFWAVRGAGGNFGVVTSFEFVANRVGEVVRASIRYDGTEIETLLTRWAQEVERSPREITSFLYLATGEPGDAPTVGCTVLYAGADSPAARSALEPFVTLGRVIESSIERARYGSLVPLMFGGQRGEAPPDARCGLAVHLSPEVARPLSEMLSPDIALAVQVRAVGGAINDVNAASTAYAHRHQNFCLVALCLPENRGRLWGAWDRLTPNLDGLYSAFETERSLPSTLAAYPSTTLARLAELKAKFDPNHLFEPEFVWRRA